MANREMTCPECEVERADYEGPNGAWLPKCPNCGSEFDPVPAGSKLTYGQHLMQCVDGYCAAREELVEAKMMCRPMTEAYSKVIEKRAAVANSINEIIREFHCPHT